MPTLRPFLLHDLFFLSTDVINSPGKGENCSTEIRWPTLVHLLTCGEYQDKVLFADLETKKNRVCSSNRKPSVTFFATCIFKPASDLTDSRDENDSFPSLHLISFVNLET